MTKEGENVTGTQLGLKLFPTFSSIIVHNSIIAFCARVQAC